MPRPSSRSLRASSNSGSVAVGDETAVAGKKRRFGDECGVKGLGEVVEPLKILQASHSPVRGRVFDCRLSVKPGSCSSALRMAARSRGPPRSMARRESARWMSGTPRRASRVVSRSPWLLVRNHSTVRRSGIGQDARSREGDESAVRSGGHRRRSRCGRWREAESLRAQSVQGADKFEIAARGGVDLKGAGLGHFAHAAGAEGGACPFCVRSQGSRPSAPIADNLGAGRKCRRRRGF